MKLDGVVLSQEILNSFRANDMYRGYKRKKNIYIKFPTFVIKKTYSKTDIIN